MNNIFVPRQVSFKKIFPFTISFFSMSVEYTWRDENGQIQPEPNPCWVIFPPNDLNKFILTMIENELLKKQIELLEEENDLLTEQNRLLKVKNKELKDLFDRKTEQIELSEELFDRKTEQNELLKKENDLLTKQNELLRKKIGEK